MLALTVTQALACREPAALVAVEDAPAEASRPPSTIPESVEGFGATMLPRVIPSTPVDLAARACTQLVGNNGLQAALNSARGGAVLCLTGTYRGSFTVPARADDGWVVIRSSVAMPAGRVHPTAIAGMARIQSPDQSTPLTFDTKAARVMVLGVEITSDSALTQGPVALVQVGTGKEATVEQLPTDIVFQQVYVHGWPSQHVRRAFAGNGGAQTLRDSWCEEIHATGFDSQCWISWNSSGPILIENNTLQAASENLMFGGADPKVPGLVTADITIRRNHISKPLSWKGAGWNVKNLVETKSSARVLVEENVLEGSWTDGQVGYAFVLKSTSQNNGCLACGSSDWTIRHNLVRNVGSGFSIAGRADQNTTFQTDSSNRRFDIIENWVGALNVAPYEGDGRPLIFLADNEDMEVRGNTFEDGTRIREAILFDISGKFKRRAVNNLKLTTNVLPKGQYGVGTTAVGEGLVAWTAGAAGKSYWTRNALMGSSDKVYPASTSWHTSLQSALGTAGVSLAVIEAGVKGVIVAR